MKIRFGALAALICVMFLFGGTVVASASGFETVQLDIDTGAKVDFGFGETDYRAVATIPARVRQDPNKVFQTWYMDGVRYEKVDPAASGPAYFDILGGTIQLRGIGDPDDPTKGFGQGLWHLDLETDDGIQYKSNGMILDFNRTEDRDVWRWNGPVIEP